MAFVQFTSEAVAGVSRPGDRSRRLGVADSLDRANAIRFPLVTPITKVSPQLVVLHTRRHQHYGVSIEITRGAGVAAC